MLESLVPVYYSDAWEDCHLHDRHNAIQMGLQQAKESIDEEVLERIQECWFHDAYLMQVNCDDSWTVNLRQYRTIRRQRWRCLFCHLLLAEISIYLQ